MFDRISIRWRLALVSSGLTFVILCAFATLFGQLTSSRIRSDFISDTANAANRLQERLTITPHSPAGYKIRPSLELYGYPNNAAIRLFWGDRRPLPGGTTPSAPDLGPPLEAGTRESNGYLIETRYAFVRSEGASAAQLAIPLWIEYARPLEDLESTINQLRLLLVLGVLGGALLALLGGLALARRSLRPVTDLTAAAQEIARTRDPDRHVPEPPTDDEVAELARTFDEMLTSLEASRQETEDALTRQRDFVADASHELRTPLTSILANLELLSDGLEGEGKEAASSALRSSQRMRRIVADLLLLARNDDQQTATQGSVNLALVTREAASEAEALTSDHLLTVEVDGSVVISGDQDQLHRMVTNLVENAVRHTPPGTSIKVRLDSSVTSAIITVEDNGPGIPSERRGQIFERFVRHAGDSGGSTGLGLAIVRTVAEAHRGSVFVEDAEPGARFVVELPLFEANGS